MQEIYGGGPRRIRLSGQQIRKMKENMRKVPEIQQKADSYHQKESEKADSLLDQFLEERPQTLSHIDKEDKFSWKEILLRKIKNFFNSFMKR